jgi:predicted alpha-1,6-mannanase (GH76 family)
LNENLDGNLGITVAMFKGAFVRNLAILNANKPEQRYTDFLMKNAESAWKQEKVNGTVIGDRWQGGERFANDVSHASGIDVLVAAARFQK